MTSLIPLFLHSRYILYKIHSYNIYFKNLYLCVSMAYTWMIILGADCSKNKKSKIIGATKRIHNKIVRIYSLFTSGMKWFNRCYDSSIKKYKLKFDFVL